MEEEEEESIGSERSEIKSLTDEELHQEGKREEELQDEDKQEEEEEEVDPRDLLTKQQCDYWRNVFDQFDNEKKQRVHVKTVGYALRFMGLNPTKVQIKKHIQEIDPLRKGMIDFEAFLLPIAQRINEEPENHEKIIEAFKVFDTEGKEFVYTDQLIDYLTSLGEDLEDFEIEAFLKIADPKGLNKVYYVEFVEKMMGIVRKDKNAGKKDKKKKK